MAAGEMRFDERLEKLLLLGRELAGRRDELVAAIVGLSKKTRRVAAGEVELALARLRSFAEVAPSLASRDPIGVVALVLPSNASLSNPVGTIGTAFLAGNRVVARFPSASRAWAELVEPLFAAHLPGVGFDHGSGPEFLRRSLADPAVGVVMVFGDDSWAAAYESEVRGARKKLIFEGPGKDPFVVLPGADLDKAARDAVRGSYYNSGQACTSPERFYVHADLAGEFISRVVELTRREVVGEPEDEAVTVGPIASERVASRIGGQLAEARQLGAKVLAGGRLQPARLADGTAVTYVEPTVLTEVSADMSIMRDETFGPVIPIHIVDDVAGALAQAAGSRYGLAASLYGGGAEDAEQLGASHGQVFCQEIWLDYCGRNLHAPYGGRKRSGWIWEWRDGSFVRREGRRNHAREFSQACP
jgi:betaine-aldehyde dehydrogenase